MVEVVVAVEHAALATFVVPRVDGVICSGNSILKGVNVYFQRAETGKLQPLYSHFCRSPEQAPWQHIVLFPTTGETGPRRDEALAVTARSRT